MNFNKITPIKQVCLNQIIFNQDFVETLDNNAMADFDTIMQCNGLVLKNIKQRSVVRLQIGGRRPLTLYIKRHRPENLGLRRLWTLLFPKKVLSQGLIEFENLSAFRQAQLSTATPIAAAQRFHSFFKVESFVITQDFAPFISLEDLLRDQPKFFDGPQGKNRKLKLLTAIAQFTRKMHLAGFNHCDFNATHSLLHYPNADQEPHLAIFDLQRVKKFKIMRFFWPIKSFAELNYTLPSYLFNESERFDLFMLYKNKKEAGIWDRLQLFLIYRKIKRISRHQSKKAQRKRNR